MASAVTSPPPSLQQYRKETLRFRLAPYRQLRNGSKQARHILLVGRSVMACSTSKVRVGALPAFYLDKAILCLKQEKLRERTRNGFRRALQYLKHPLGTVRRWSFLIFLAVDLPGTPVQGFPCRVRLSKSYGLGATTSI